MNGRHQIRDGIELYTDNEIANGTWVEVGLIFDPYVYFYKEDGQLDKIEKICLIQHKHGYEIEVVRMKKGEKDGQVIKYFRNNEWEEAFQFICKNLRSRNA